jgi:hypothetical protein
MQRRGLYAPEGPFVCGVNFVDADVGDVDRDLARAGVRDVDVDDLDRVGSAGVRDERSSHRDSLSGVRVRHGTQGLAVALSERTHEEASGAGPAAPAIRRRR